MPSHKCLRNVTFKTWNVPETWHLKHEFMFQKRDVRNMKYFRNVTFITCNVSDMWHSKYKMFSEKWHSKCKMFPGTWRSEHESFQKRHVSETLFGHATPFCCASQLCNLPTSFASAFLIISSFSYSPTSTLILKLIFE